MIFVRTPLTSFKIYDAAREVIEGKVNFLKNCFQIFTLVHAAG